MNVPTWLWWATVLVTTSLLLVDLVIVGRRPHEPSMREVTRHLAAYIGLAVAFGLGVSAVAGPRYGGEFFAGWLTEYSLSVDNLFIFIIIMAKFAVPKVLQQSALRVGIVVALVLRGAFIAVGAVAIERFSWVFYLFGAFLVWTAVKLAREGAEDEDEFEENRLILWIERRLPATKEYQGAAVVIRQNGRWLVTPMLVVMLTIGTTDLLFALDSIPAIYGLTQEPYLVFTANVFALMGLRQLYFLIGGLLQRLIYLSKGLAFLLGFIGVKLVFHALHTNEVPFINGGNPVEWVPDIPIWVSLLVIVGTLGITTAASLIGAKRRSEAYLDEHTGPRREAHH
jgi:tellurite resistance protein TerC